MTAQLWAAGSKDNPCREVDHTKMSIGDLDAEDQPHILLDPPKHRRGFYRFDIQFHLEARRDLGSYSVHLRVVRSFWSARLGLTGRSAHPGQQILSRVENFGTRSLAYGEEIAVQRFERGRWAWEPEFTQEASFLWLGDLCAGSSGRCSALTVPADGEPGRYRVIKEVFPTLDPKGPTRSPLCSLRVIR